MGNYYIRYHCPHCGQLHGIYDFIEYPAPDLSGSPLSDVYSPNQLERFRGLTFHCWPDEMGEIDVDRLVFASVIAVSKEQSETMLRSSDGQ
jgi:hypothetical protein